jgi:hypothetical protein
MQITTYLYLTWKLIEHFLTQLYFDGILESKLLFLKTLKWRNIAENMFNLITSWGSKVKLFENQYKIFTRHNFKIGQLK